MHARPPRPPAPYPAMASLPADAPPALPDLSAHLTALISLPESTDLDVRLVETFTAQLTGAFPQPLALLHCCTVSNAVPDTSIPVLIPLLVPQISATLPHVRVDPTSLTTLLLRLLAPVSFADILLLASQETILEALSAPSPPIQLLGLSLLSKASASPTEASIVASWIEVLRKVTTMALVDEDTGVSTKAADVLTELLTVDLVATGGNGMVWRRMFSDSGIYALFYALPSWSGEDLGSKRRKTEAQGRLLSLLPRILKLDFELLTRPLHAELEKPHMPGASDTSLLAFTVIHMAQIKDDVMLHMVLIDFFTALLNTVGTLALVFLQTRGVHERTVNLYLDPGAFTDDTLDSMLLESKAADYIAVYTNLFPRDSPLAPLANRVKQHLISSPQDPHSPSLTVLRCIPTATLPGHGIARVIPLSPPRPEYLSTLSTLFSNKALYAEVLASHPEMYAKLLEYAGTAALGPAAMAALDVLEAIALAGSVPTASEWSQEPPIAGVAATGAEELTRHVEVLQFLCADPERFVGGVADPESWAWRVARRRWDLVGSIARQPGAARWKEQLEERYRGGIWGESRSLDIATEEM